MCAMHPIHHACWTRFYQDKFEYRERRAAHSSPLLAQSVVVSFPSERRKSGHFNTKQSTFNARKVLKCVCNYITETHFRTQLTAARFRGSNMCATHAIHHVRGTRSRKDNVFATLTGMPRAQKNPVKRRRVIDCRTRWHTSLFPTRWRHGWESLHEMSAEVGGADTRMWSGSHIDHLSPLPALHFH